jgi:TonB family protein
VQVALPKPDVPVPTTMVPPVYPPRALGNGVVIVELAVDASGAVKNTRVVRSAGGFDGAALDAARKWQFRPAQRAGAAVPSYAYIVFGFRQPIT